jgi:hypothetical protein
MKKILSLTLAVFLIAACLLTLASCGAASEVVGTYEMISLSGAVTYNGQTTTLNKNSFTYYRITLSKNGDCKVEAKAADSTAKTEQEGTWEYDEESGTLSVKSEDAGVTVIEEMQWEDGIITYNSEQTQSGMKIKLRMKLEKQE